MQIWAVFGSLVFGLPLCSSRTASALTSFISYLLFRSKNPHDKLSTTNYGEFGAVCRAFHRMFPNLQPNVAKLVLSILPAYARQNYLSPLLPKYDQVYWIRVFGPSACHDSFCLYSHIGKNNKFKLFSELDIILTRINFAVHSPTAEWILELLLK